MKVQTLLGIFVLFLLVIPSVNSVCTLTLDKSAYFPLETATVTATCSEVDEKNDAYIINWSYSNGTLLEQDTGTTPAQVDTNFFETYVLPSGFNATHDLYVNMTGGDTEGSDSATVSAASSAALILTNVAFSTDKYLGTKVGIEFDIADENGKKVSNALCAVYVEDNDGLPIDTSIKPFITLDGVGKDAQLISDNNFDEGTTYLITFNCICGASGTSAACFDEDGTEVSNSAGSVSGPATINTWLTTNTVVDRSIYEMKDEIFICVNVTNVAFSSRIPINLYHQVRCSREGDNNDDLDRVLVLSDDNEPDTRGISTGTTQMQCKRFIIPEAKFMQGRNSECYASTSVWVLNDLNEEIVGYHTTSPVFNVTSDELNLRADWERINDYQWKAIVNLSDSKYHEINGTGTGNIDVKLTTPQALEINHVSQTNYPMGSFDNLYAAERIANVTVVNETGTEMTSALEYLEDGYLEIEIRSVPIDPSGVFNITMNLNSFEERSMDAFEDIANKTGTFHSAIACPEYGVAGQPITCNLTSRVEADQVMQKEVDFTCYLTVDGVLYGNTNFNQMINRSTYSMNLSFPIPGNATYGVSYSVTCLADYYNLGSRRDTFSDAFVIGTSQDQSGLGDGDKDVALDEKDGVFSFYTGLALIWQIIIPIVLLLVVVIVCIKVKKKKDYNKMLSCARTAGMDEIKKL